MPRTTSTGRPTAPTLQQVATTAGVSLATASRVLHGSGGRQVRPELADRVRQAASQLQYVAHGPAQSLARARSSTVGLLVHDIADPYFAVIAGGCMKIARQHDLMVLVANTFRDPSLERDYIARLRAQRAMAVVLAGSAFADDALPAPELAAFTESGGRMVSIGPRDGDVAAVLPANADGGRLAATHLKELGHTRIGVISGPSELVSVQERLAGFTSVFSSPEVVAGDFTREGGAAGAAKLASRDVTAIFAMNDLAAAGALSYLRESGMEVPGQISVIGFDDLPVAIDVTPGLTTVRLDLHAIGASAMELVLGPEERPTAVTVPASLVVRRSTSAVAR